MLSSKLFRPITRTRVFLKSFAHRAEGIAAVEFALIVPIMVVLFIGAVEMSQAITVNRRVTQVGSTAGDLVARASENISATDIADIMNVGSYLLSPYNPVPLKVDISVIASTASSATDTKQQWICTYNGSNPGTVACTCPKTAYALPATGMVTTSDYVVVADVTYAYKPPLFDVFMKATWGGSGTYNMKEKVYLKPRSNCPQITKSDGTTCGC
jgi:Flp pilus assembly protein TadG